MSDERLEIIVESEASQASAEMDKLISQFDILGKQIGKLTNVLSKSENSISKGVSNISRTVESGSQNIVRSLAKISATVYTLKRTFSGLGKSIKSAMDYQETVHLFSTVFTRIGRRAGEDFYEGFFDRINEFQSKFITLGIDPDALMNYQAVFAQMSDSMGVLPRTAYEISESFTALGADLSALFNLPIEDSMLKLQAGLSGQIRPLRQLGIDISKTTLMEEARMRGITKSIEVMTASEKVQLRYLAIMRQTQVAHGDMAKTIMSPANSLRVLNQQFKMAARAIGSIFLPMIQKVLPYLIAMAMVIQRIAYGIAGLFGYKLPKLKEEITFDYDDGIIGDWDKEQDNIGKTGKKLKKLKNQLMGFDEVHVLQDPDNASSGSGGKKGFGAGAGFDLSDEIAKMNESYQGLVDKILGETMNKAEKIADKLEEPFKNILKAVGLIGLGILSWKIADKLYKLFTGQTTDNGLLASILRIGKAIVRPSGELLKMQSVLGNSTAYMATEAVLAAMAGTILIMILRTLDLIKNSETFRRGIATIYKGMKTGLSWISEKISSIGSAITDSLKGFDKLPGIGKLVKALDLDFADLLITLGGFILLFTPLGVFGKALLIFEALTVAVRAVGFAASDAVDEFDLFADISDTTREKLEPFMENMHELDVTLKQLEFGNIKITDDIVQDVTQKVKTISQTIIDELDADKNEALKTLEPLRHALGEEAYNKLITDNNKYYAELTEKVKTGEEEIIKIIENANKEGREITAEEWTEINRIRDEMNDTGIKHLSETEIEYNTIMNRLKDNSVRVSLEQARDIIQNAQKTRDETIDAAETQYSKIELEAKRMLDVGAISDEQYNEIMKAAEKTRDETIKDAEDQYNSIYDTTTEKLGDTAKYIDSETGEIRSKWDVFTEDLKNKWSDRFDEISTKLDEWKRNINTAMDEFYRKFKRGWKTFWKQGVGNFFIDIINGIISGFESMVNWITDGLNTVIDRYNKTAGNIPLIGGKIQVSNVSRVSFGRIPRFATGGIPNYGQLFIAREAGAELVGGYGRKTAVMNNDQIVDAVSTGVYQAVASAMAINSVGSNETEKEIVMNIEGNKMARIMLPLLDREATRLGYKSILQTD